MEMDVAYRRRNRCGVGSPVLLDSKARVYADRSRQIRYRRADSSCFSHSLSATAMDDGSIQFVFRLERRRNTRKVRLHRDFVGGSMRSHHLLPRPGLSTRSDLTLRWRLTASGPAVNIWHDSNPYYAGDLLSGSLHLIAISLDGQLQ
jgi:hypothetical protein